MSWVIPPAAQRYDIQQLVDRLDVVPDCIDPAIPLWISRAPGRLDLMGGIADYAGSLVLQMPIAEAACCALQVLPDATDVVLVSWRDDGSLSRFSCTIDDLEQDGEALSPSAARHFFQSCEAHWAAYLLGPLLQLRKAFKLPGLGGIRLVLDSRVPEGKGVSSSAAIEVAAMQVFAAAYEVDLDGPRLATLCQLVENHIVGAPCGIMDQMSSACGQEWSLLALRCQPADIIGQLQIPEDLAIWGIDSGIRHQIAGADYGSVRIGAFMGYRILAELAGLPVQIVDGLAQIDDSRWAGYLANVRPSSWATWETQIPEQISGRDFLELYGASSDPITQIDPERSYAVRIPARHPIDEHHRIRCFAELLGRPASPRRNELLGECMYQSHASYGRCGLGSDGTDHLVDLVRQEPSLYGAKITGGGSGGTVAVLGQVGADSAIERVRTAYADTNGHLPQLFNGSSPGARIFGTHLLTAEAS